jgi:hypothetical protein
MKQLILLGSAVLLFGAGTADNLVKKGFERAIERYERDACDKARAAAKRGYEIVDINPGCHCERTDGHMWQCDIRFTYIEREAAAD